MGVSKDMARLEAIASNMRLLGALHDRIYEVFEKLEFNPRLDESQRRTIKSLMERLEEI